MKTNIFPRLVMRSLLMATLALPTLSVCVGTLRASTHSVSLATKAKTSSPNSNIRRTAPSAKPVKDCVDGAKAPIVETAIGIKNAATGAAQFTRNVVNNPPAAKASLQHAAASISQVVKKPELVVGAVTQPYKDSVQSGHPAAAVCRGVVEVGSLAVGAGEIKVGASAAKAVSLAGRAVKVEAAAGKAAEAAYVTTRASQAAKVTSEVVSDTSRISARSVAIVESSNTAKGAQKLPKLTGLNQEHIFVGENHGGKASGFHSESAVAANKAKVLTKTAPDAQGVSEAVVSVRNKASGVEKTKSSTLFPAEWSESKVRAEIRGAYVSSDAKATGQNGALVNWAGTSPSGLKIEGKVNPASGTIKTAYPTKK